MVECPSDDDLRRLLSGEIATVGPHLDSCERCRARADRLSDDRSLRGWAVALAARPRDPTEATDVDRLVEALCAGDRRELGRDGEPPRSTGPTVLLGPGRDPVTLGPFVLEAEVGRGGMGVVYRARDDRSGRIVALKVLHDEPADDRTRRRFLQEVRAAALVDHDHLVRLYSTADPSDAPLYFVMEFVKGPSLAEELRERRHLAPREAAELVAQAATGLAAAHAAGLVHRDVKPGNILIERATGRAKLGDFGLARIASEPPGPTREGVVAGTPAYLSPEQARGDVEAGPLSDVYALGVTLYECLTGEPPFRGTPHRIVDQILRDEPRPPRSLNDALPRDLQTVCLKAMAKEAPRRYAGALEFAADLRRWLAGEPIRARPIGPAGRMWRLVRRHPRVSALAASLLVALASGVAGILWQWRRAEANGRQARHYLARTLESIDVYFTRISESRLLDVPSLQPLRKELLAAARDYYRDLLRDRPDDPAVRAELAKARTRLAVVVALVGSYDEALDLLGRSLAEFDQILAGRPGDTAAKDGRIACLTNTAAVQMHASRLDDCRATLVHLLASCEADRRARPGAVAPREGLYAAYHDRGRIAAMKREPVAAIIAEFEHAMAVNRELIARDPDHAPYLRNLSRTAALLSDAYRTNGREAEGWSVLDEGHRAAKRLRAEHPESLEYRFALAPYEVMRGNRAFHESFATRGEQAVAKLEEARRFLAAALGLDRGLVRESPQVDAYRIDLLGIVATAAAVESSLGRRDAAMALLREARELYDAIRHLDNQHGFAKLAMAEILMQEAHELSDAGRTEEALARMDQADATLASLTARERDAQGGTALAEASLACGRAVILCEADRVPESLPVWARALSTAPRELHPLIEIGRELYRGTLDPGSLPDARRALAAVPMGVALSTSRRLPPCSDVAYAKIFALAALASEEGDRERLQANAVIRLERAALAGYFRRPGRLNAVESSPILGRLAARPDYHRFRDVAISR